MKSRLVGVLSAVAVIGSRFLEERNRMSKLRRKLVALAAASVIALSAMSGTAMAASEVQYGKPIVVVEPSLNLVAVVIITGFQEPVIVTDQRNTVVPDHVLDVDVALIPTLS